MFGRRKTTDKPAAEQQTTGPGKNRPTPKRREVEAARRQPLVPTSRSGSAGKGGGKAARQAAREERVEARARMMSGEERYLMPRDRGPVRRFARDYVDARWNLGELLLPVMMVVLALSFVSSSLQQRSPGLFGGMLAVTYAMVVMAVFDAVLMSLRIKKGLRARFGADVDVKGITWYSIMRAFQIRRTRVPRPAGRRGQPPA